MNQVLAERLFDRFYTVETGKNATGLGLSIARALTEQMGGEIYASYEEEYLVIEVRFCSRLREEERVYQKMKFIVDTRHSL